MPRLLRAVFYPLLVLCACSPTENSPNRVPEKTAPPPSGSTGTSQARLTGISSQLPNGKRIIFVGYRADIKQQMLDSLAGTALDGPWYRVEISGNLPTMPSKTDYSLKDQGINLVVRKAWVGLNKSGEFLWTTEFVSGQPGVSGGLSVMGPNMPQAKGTDENGDKWTLGFDLRYVGIVLADVKGETRETDLRLTVAASFELGDPTP